jgi:hypothetical protein
MAQAKHRTTFSGDRKRASAMDRMEAKCSLKICKVININKVSIGVVLLQYEYFNKVSIGVVLLQYEYFNKVSIGVVLLQYEYFNQPSIGMVLVTSLSMVWFFYSMNTSTSLTIKSPKTNICGFPSPMSYL